MSVTGSSVLGLHQHGRLEQANGIAVSMVQACFTAFLRTFCARLKSQYGRDGRLGTKISQVEQFCAEVGQHLLVRPHAARSALPSHASLLTQKFTCSHEIPEPTHHAEGYRGSVLGAGLVPSKQKGQQSAQTVHLCLHQRTSALWPSMS